MLGQLWSSLCIAGRLKQRQHQLLRTQQHVPIKVIDIPLVLKRQRQHQLLRIRLHPALRIHAFRVSDARGAIPLYSSSTMPRAGRRHWQVCQGLPLEHARAGCVQKNISQPVEEGADVCWSPTQTGSRCLASATAWAATTGALMARTLSTRTKVGLQKEVSPHD